MTRAQMEARRLEAIPEIDAWQEPSRLARKFQISRTTLYRWKKARVAGNDLKRKRAPGRPGRMTVHDDVTATLLFHAGPRIILGIDADRWTQAKFSQAIEQELGIKFHHDHADRIMHRLGLVPKRKRRK